MTLLLDYATATTPPETSANGVSGFTTLTYEQWERQGETIWNSSQQSQWATGDWLLTGEYLFGDDHMNALDETRYSFHTLENIRYVCKAFPVEERRADISFSNHSECASLQGEQRTYAMNMLASGAWNRANVRAWKKELKGIADKPKTKTVNVNPVNYYSDGKRLIVTFDCADVPSNVISWHVKVAA